MKKFTQLLTAFVFLSLIVFVACKKDSPSEPTVEIEDTYGSAIAGTWTVSSATFDQSARTEWSEDFSLIINYNEESNQGNIVVNNVPADEGAEDVWGSNLTWSFSGLSEGSTQFTIERADNVDMAATVNNAEAPTQITLTFTITDPNARIEGFYGEWEFVLTK